METNKRVHNTGLDNPEQVGAAPFKSGSDDYVIRVFEQPEAVPRQAWNELLALEDEPSPFMRHEYLSALTASGCATAQTGWMPRFLTLWRDATLQAACPLYIKHHSYGEYVFDWAWADAYAQHGLPYHPKALVAVPFTPVPGPRLLARDARARHALLQALLQWTQERELSSLHVLFATERDQLATQTVGLLQRHTVQFHWTNAGYRTFDHFLGSLQQEKRKKIRQERRKVEAAGVRFRHATGRAITEADWDFFYRCYSQTYFEHGNAPYLNRPFFSCMARDMADHWLLFVAERDGRPMACSLIGLDPAHRVAYGRYWGALERVDCLYFEACYYQPLQWCIEHGWRRFEGGAQGEHKMARALLPVRTASAHWLAHPAFADAVDRFLQRERDGMEHYLTGLRQRSPVRTDGPGGRGS
ncbi:MAG: GNAT family N-acetyltransferase [Hydrogenophaga sp.]